MTEWGLVEMLWQGRWNGLDVEAHPWSIPVHHRNYIRVLLHNVKRALMNHHDSIINEDVVLNLGGAYGEIHSVRRIALNITFDSGGGGGTLPFGLRTRFMIDR